MATIGSRINYIFFDLDDEGEIENSESWNSACSKELLQELKESYSHYVEIEVPKNSKKSLATRVGRIKV